jgi:octaprenyl-diphosphate synthase
MELKKIFLPIADDLGRVEECIEEQLQQIVEKAPQRDRTCIEDSVRHLFRVPGKKLRPALVLLSARAVNGDRSDIGYAVIQVGAAVELLHSASLIHDDIIDESGYRRKQLSLDQKYGNRIAVLVGDILYAQFFYLLTALAVESWELKQQIFSMFWNTAQKMCIAEIEQQQVLRSSTAPGNHEYLNILENKTALLMASCCECGAALQGGSEEQRESLRSVGLQFGMAYQLIDDFLDNDGVIGKNYDALGKAEQYIQGAVKDIEPFPESESRKSFRSLGDFLLVRTKEQSAS